MRWAVAGVRALGRAGLAVAAMAPARASAGLWSRYTAARESGPDSVEHPAAFAAAVGAVAERAGPLVVYPSHEESIDALFEADLPPGATLPYADAAVTQAFRDKRRLAELAGSAGLPVPRTLLEVTAGELAGQAVALPCAVKAARPGGSLGFTRLIDDADQLRELLAELPPDEPLVVQERAAGPLIGLALVVGRDGRQVARFQQVARRMWPPAAGGSTLALSTEVDEDLAERSTAMLAGAGYSGLAQLQFLRTSRGHALIDVNTRYYGSMPLATAAGVNLPAAWHAVVTGTADGAPPPQYRVGMTYRWLEPELVAALRGSPRLLLARGPRPRSGAMWASDDPVPSALLALESATSRVGRVLRRLRTSSA
jgi:predicted ATP-grasp superfamily ATP-dependent carboligase